MLKQGYACLYWQPSNALEIELANMGHVTTTSQRDAFAVAAISKKLESMMVTKDASPGQTVIDELGESPLLLGALCSISQSGRPDLSYNECQGTAGTLESSVAS